MRRARRESEKTVYQQQDRRTLCFFDFFVIMLTPNYGFISLDCSENNKKSK
jgi:hypothetical protein